MMWFESMDWPAADTSMVSNSVNARGSGRVGDCGVWMDDHSMKW